MREAQNTTAEPFVFAPSQGFTGNDGRWSTFILRIGTPEQNFAVLPSTTGHETLIPMPEGCTAGDPANCAELRGAYPFNGKSGTGLQVNASSTWQSIGLYTLDVGERFGMEDNGLYGLDRIGLQVQSSGGLTLDNQVVAGIATKDIYLGSFGLGPKPSNFSNYEHPIPSFMQTLKDNKAIPSISYGYTAGAAYTIPQQYASLTLGGYDASRFIDSGRAFPFNEDDSSVLTLGVQKITATNTIMGARSMLHDAILSVIDSTTPYIWLPKDSCDSFAEAFGLTFDNTTNLYTVNDTTHKELQSLKPSIVFSLGNDVNPAELTTITIPYGAFDLQAAHPIYANATNYFPIRRATNDSQYTLGRAFLQAAYVIADYERSTFSVHQTQAGSTQRIVRIAAPSDEKGTEGVLHSTTRNKIGKPAIIGLAVGVAALLLVIVLVGFFMYRRRRKHIGNDISQTSLEEEDRSGNMHQELPVESKFEMYHAPPEAYGSQSGVELQAKSPHYLLSDDFVGTPDGINRTHELSGH